MEGSNDSKKTLILGIAIGVAVISTVGFFSLLVKGGTGASISNDNNNIEVANNNNPTPAQPAQNTPPKVASSDHIRGNKDAKVIIIEFSDYQCPFCVRFHDTMKQVMEEYGNDVGWVYKHFPLDSLHPYARKAAEAAECASEQGKFWEYTDKLYEKQSEIRPENFEKFAKELGLKTSDFMECLDSGKYASKVNSDYQAGVSGGVRGTPGSFINGQLVSGAQPFESLKQIIDSLLQ